MNRYIIRSFTFAFLVAAVLLTGCPGGPARPSDGDGGSFSRQNPVPPGTASPMLRTGDTIGVSIIGVSAQEERSLTLQIDDDGYVTMAFIGRVQAEGLTAPELADVIEQTYIEEEIYRQVNVVVSIGQRFVTVGGEVRNPGQIPWRADLTIASAISSASGFTIWAAERRVVLNREGRSYIIDVELAQIDPREDVDLLPAPSEGSALSSRAKLDSNLLLFPERLCWI